MRTLLAGWKRSLGRDGRFRGDYHVISSFWEQQCRYGYICRSARNWLHRIGLSEETRESMFDAVGTSVRKAPQCSYGLLIE